MDGNLDFQRCAKLINALANNRRLQILDVISTREMRVGELARQLGMTPSLVSQHLGKLRTEKLIVSRRDGQCIYYTTSHPHVIRIIDALRHIHSEPTDGSSNDGGTAS